MFMLEWFHLMEKKWMKLSFANKIMFFLKKPSLVPNKEKCEIIFLKNYI